MSCQNCQCSECKDARTTKARKAKLDAVNERLYNVGAIYYSTFTAATQAIELALSISGYCSVLHPVHDGRTCFRIHEEVGVKVWLTATLYRMESGNWEVVAYVS